LPAALNNSARWININCHLNIEPSFKTKPREALATIRFPIEELEENASILGTYAPLLKGAAAAHISTLPTNLISTLPTGPDNRRIEELEEEANIYGGLQSY
jgi:hypothetical protein